MLYSPAVLPVIHFQSPELSLLNAERAFDAGCDGVFLIHMDGVNDVLAPVAKAIKARWPDKLVGVNYLDMPVVEALKRNIAEGLDMTWTDEQLTYSGNTEQSDAVAARQVLWTQPGHLLFAGVAFKYRAHEPHPEQAARAASAMGFIPTTSGPATGAAADVEKLRAMRNALGDAPLAVASGITPENAEEFAPFLSHILVATGVSSSFYELDYEKMCRLKGVFS